MSTTYRTYIGPYVRCAVGTVEITRQRRACTNVACPNHTQERIKDAFCSLCGSSIGDVSYTEIEDTINDWDIIEEIGEELTPAFGDAYQEWVGEHHAHIWVANVATPGRDYHLDERVDFALVEIMPDMIREEMAQFEAQFAPALAVFRSRYGAGAVTLCWGIVQDYS